MVKEDCWAHEEKLQFAAHDSHGRSSLTPVPSSGVVEILHAELAEFGSNIQRYPMFAE